jgi:hypothetical protein
MYAANIWVLLGMGLVGIVLVRIRWKKGIKEYFGSFIEHI